MNWYVVTLLLLLLLFNISYTLSGGLQMIAAPPGGRGG